MTREGQLLKSLIEFSITTGLDELKEYLDTNEKFLQKMRGDLEACLNERAALQTAEERAQFLESYSDVYGDYTDIFPNIFRNSFFVSALSVLEYELRQICRWFEREEHIPISWNDLRPGVLFRAEKYLELAGLAVSYNDIRDEVKNYYEVRNCIVHNNGLIKEDCKNLITYTKKRGLLHKSDDELTIVLTKDFCEDAVKNLKAFLDSIYNAI